MIASRADQLETTAYRVTCRPLRQPTRMRLVLRDRLGATGRQHAANEARHNRRAGSGRIIDGPHRRRHKKSGV